MRSRQEAMLKRTGLAENHMLRKIFLLLCGLFLLMLSLFLYQTFKPHYSYYEPNYFNEDCGETEERRRSLTIPESDEIAGNSTNDDEQWERDDVYFGDDLLSSADEGLQRYRIHTSARMWYEAVTTCWNEGGHLATPEDEEESRLLGRILKAAMDTGNVTNTEMKVAMHVGLNYIVSYTWTTLQGDKVENGYWLRKMDDCSKGRNMYHSCSAVLPNGRIIGHRCAENLIYACDMKQKNQTTNSEDSTYLKITSDGYEAIGSERRYRIHRSPLSFWDALEVCENEGGLLMVPWKKEEGQQLSQWFTAHLPESVSSGGILLGIHDISEAGSWLNTQGTYFSWNYWDSGERGREKNCAVLLPSAKIDFISCNEPRPFICEKKIPENVREEIEYVLVEGLGSYALHTIPKNWGQAVLQCLFENATLAVPDSPREAQVLADMYRKCTVCSHKWVSPDFLWVGINDLDEDKIWRKLTGDRTFGSGFNEWSPSAISGMNSLYCGGLQNGSFINNYCENRNLFICKKPL